MKPFFEPSDFDFDSVEAQQKAAKDANAKCIFHGIDATSPAELLALRAQNKFLKQCLEVEKLKNHRNWK